MVDVEVGVGYTFFAVAWVGAGATITTDVAVSNPSGTVKTVVVKRT